MKKIYIFIPIFLTIFALVFYIVYPIISNKEKVYNWYNTIGNPKDFSYGLNINSSKSYEINFCFITNITSKFFSPNFLVTHSTDKISDKYYTDIDIFNFSRKDFPYFSLKPNITTRYTVNLDFENAFKKSNEYCSLDFENLDPNRNYFKYSDILKFKQDAINNPKQQTPDTLTPEQARQEIERQIKEEESTSSSKSVQ